ncbi:hypothetical protein [Micromonospora chersina]|uniref:hypothetical protein n=1 Tax=Micromonospora chersina TaxID=47854 RepID=UPI0037199E25
MRLPTGVIGVALSWPAGLARRRLAVELVSELEGIDKTIKGAEKDLKELVAACGSTLMELHGIGPSGAGRLLEDAGDISQFADRDHRPQWLPRTRSEYKP